MTEKEPDALWRIAPILPDRRDILLRGIASREAVLRESFSELEVLDYRRRFAECVTPEKVVLGKR